MLYYYFIKIEHEDENIIVFSHEKYFHQFEISNIIKETIDKCVDRYISNSTYPMPCKITYESLITNPMFILVMKEKGFELCNPLQTVEIPMSYLFTEELSLYKDKVINECEKCTQKDKLFYNGCPVLNKRRRIKPSGSAEIITPNKSDKK